MAQGGSRGGRRTKKAARTNARKRRPVAMVPTSSGAEPSQTENDPRQALPNPQPENNPRQSLLDSQPENGPRRPLPDSQSDDRPAGTAGTQSNSPGLQPSSSLDTNAGDKRRRDANDEGEDSSNAEEQVEPEDYYHSKGKMIIRFLDMWSDLREVLRHGARRYPNDPDEMYTAR
ncbi:hypothetical protein FISHEDRAFT_58045 [Fistulina hepatica ATCC 64428]|uniref:Uncharacterized protein n=1 Tax=Fistulina hepatica ATCC 64428 TaxID=1128425 RepID=A0A0D7AEK8_9AGAR|nr:hypothetical protein FISHEDRAFT_58045 [Fistulina hepatica ATCC 64428]